MGLRSPAASCSQPARTPSGRLQRSSRLVAKRRGLITALFSLGNSTGGGSGLLIEIVLLGCLSGARVVSMIPLDRVFVPLCRFLGRFGSCKVGHRVNHWVSVAQHVMYRQSQGVMARVKLVN